MKLNLRNISCIGIATIAMSLAACGDDNDDVIMPPAPDDNKPEQPVQPEKANYNEQYRPQIHFTPAKNWMNDPNGMVYADGTWHLFYQYNPQGNGWGNMSWGHATSTDLMHWQEQDVALVHDHLGDIFSGSAVIDKDNTSGLGKDAMVCFYTSSGSRQQQSMAYSTDGGKTFKTYSGNPIIGNTDMDDFRDPKVFWHEESHQWIMSLARGWTYAIDFYASADLKSWRHISTFSTPDHARCNKGQWECPDLMKIGDKWVLLVSTNPGGPTSGSGTMYFVGNFDGTTFTADPRDYPLWMDYGMDNYAGVTWSNTGDRHVLIGWMNNWNYAGDVPCSPWRSAMTLPRELTLTQIDGKPYLGSAVVKEVDKIAGEWQTVGGTFPEASAYQLQVTVDLSTNSTISLANEKGQHYDIEIKGAAKTILARRSGQAGAISFNNSFAIPATQAPIFSNAQQLTLNIFIDQSSVEILSEDGTTSITNLVFPSSIYNSCTAPGTAKVRPLSSVWR